ncbi:MAG: pentapeptide repeat-containing protein [Planctomycetota bacterium]|jgi:hypothetical protein|nr:pentapeptide repeat-containing protein [Planctomycetota bacterium]
MPEATAATGDLEILDDLIARLEKMIADAEEAPIAISYSDQPKKAVYRPIGNAANAVDRKAQAADAVYLTADRMVMRTPKTELVRLMTIEVTVRAGKTGRGETSAIITGMVSGMKRVRGGYEITVDVSDTRRVTITPGQKLRESVERIDAAGWNRWCQEIKDHIDLSGINLEHADLSGFDLCYANLSGADLSGADLTGAILAGADLSRTNLDGAAVTGADFFRVRLNRKYAGLLTQTGMPEIESVVFVIS